jgi:hypothetical protein
MKKQKLPKLKKGAWFVRVRGSYLPMTPQAWLLHALLIASVVSVIYASYYDQRGLAVVVTSTILQLLGLGAIFTYIASKHA